MLAPESALRERGRAPSMIMNVNTGTLGVPGQAGDKLSVNLSGMGRRMSMRRRSSVASPVKQEAPSDNDKFKFKYIRLRCLNVNKTLDFYQAIGMSLQWDLDLDDNTRAFYLNFQTNDDDFNERSIGLLFEYIEPPQETEGTKKKSRTFWELPDDKTRWSRDSIVLYVRFLSRLYKRLQAKDWKIKVSLETYFDIQFMVMEDPNGLEVRLVECTEQQLVDTDIRTATEEQWFARFGYFSAEVTSGEPVTSFYEKYLAQASNLTAAAVNKVDVSSILTPTNRKLGTSFNTKTGFRVVDSEDLINGLGHDYFWWMANDTRERYGSINFVERSVASGTVGEETKANSANKVMKPSPILIAFGFELNKNLTIEQIKKSFGKDFQFTEWNRPLLDFGNVIRVTDPSDRMYEIFISASSGENIATRRAKTDRRVKQEQQQAKVETETRTDRPRAKSFSLMVDRISYATDMNQLMLLREDAQSIRKTKSFDDLAKLKLENNK